MIKKYGVYIVLFFLILPTFYQLIRPGFFPMQDDIQAFRIHQMVKCLEDLQIPCRWVPDMGYQYGYPKFNYYPPLPYYIGAILHLSGIQIIDAVKILFILGFILSTLSMFIFLKALLNNWAALLGTILYSYIPVKATQVYVRGALSEFWAFIFLPLLFFSSYQLIRDKKIKNLIWFSFSLGLLLLTHNLASLIFLPILLIWILAWLFLEKKWSVSTWILLAGFLGLGLSSFYLLPVIFERQFVHLETLLGGYFDYRQHFVSIKQLLFSNYFNYGSSVFGLGDDVSLSTGIVHWVVALFGLKLSVIFYKKEKKFAKMFWVLFGLELLVLFLMHIKSSFIWERIAVLVYLQFPWRFLVPSAFLLSILSAMTLFFIFKFSKKYALVFGLVIAVSVIFLHASFFKPKEWLMISDQEKFSDQYFERQLTTSIFDYLPIFAYLPPNKKAPNLPEVLEGHVEFLNYQKGSNYQVGKVQAKEDSLIRLPLFDFPGMKVLVDGKVVAHVNNNCIKQEYCLGLITFNVPQGNHLIRAQLYNTPIRLIGNITTLASFSILIFLSFKYYVFNKNS